MPKQYNLERIKKLIYEPGTLGHETARARIDASSGKPGHTRKVLDKANGKQESESME